MTLRPMLVSEINTGGGRCPAYGATAFESLTDIHAGYRQMSVWLGSVSGMMNIEWLLPTL